MKHKTEVYDGEHEPIVDGAVFERVQVMLQRNGRSGGAEARNKCGALLRGLLRCKACNRTMTHTFTSKGSRRYRYYTCTQAIKGGRKRCPSGSLPAGEIEHVVLEQVREMVNDPAWVADTLAEAGRELERRRERLVGEQRSLQRAVRQYAKQIEDLVTQEDGPDSAVGQVADLNDQIRDAERRLRTVDEELAGVQGQEVSHADVAAALGDLGRTWETLSHRERARVVQLLVDRVDYDVSDSTIEVVFHAEGIAALATDPAMEAA